MRDVVKELREVEDDKWEGHASPALCGRAADEIERLRGLLSDLIEVADKAMHEANMGDWADYDRAAVLAKYRAALGAADRDAATPAP